MTDDIGIGHNQPPPDLKVGAALAEDLRDNHTDLTARRDELLAGADRFDAEYAAVEDDEVSGRLAAFITQINACVKTADGIREKEKAPYLEGGRIVDGFFNGGIITPLVNRAKQLNQKQTAYLRAKADRARREAEERAAQARAAEEARRKEAEKAEHARLKAERDARRAKDDAEREAAEARAKDARERAEQARQAEEAARAERQTQQEVEQSSNAARSRVRGEMAQTSLRTTWRWELIDITKVPPDFLMVNERMVKTAISGPNGRRDIPGLRIYPDTDAVNR